MTTTRAVPERGIALLAVLFALLLLMLLALPFSVSMGVGAEAASRDVDRTAAEQASASVRDLLLANAAISHLALDPTPNFDSRSEWPDHVDLPAAFAELRGDGRTLLGGEVWDLQRFLSLDALSPLVLTNLLGSTTRLREDLAPGATAVPVEDADALPEAGYVWLAHELIRYTGKQGNVLTGATRGMLAREMGFAEGGATLATGTLVLDYRCVLAAAWPFLGRSRGNSETRRPFTNVADLVEIATAGFGSFTPDELDTLRASLSADTLETTSSTWGKPERVFEKLNGSDPDPTKRSRTLLVKSALHLGAGSTVRIRNLRTNTVEHGLVMTSKRGQQPTSLKTVLYQLDLLMPVVHDFPAIDTVVEPLVPIPINVNTASIEVLTAAFAELRRSADVIAHEADGQRRMAPPPSFSRSQARELAEEIVARRVEDGGAGTGPLAGWQDFVERIVKPRLEASNSDQQKQLWIRVYRNLQTGRDGEMEMGTVPICFASGPWVGYRAAASRSRSVVAPGVAARHERTGLAAAIPGYTLEQTWNTQQRFEEAFRLHRWSPYWVTTPINLGAVPPGDGNDPTSRSYPHLVPIAFPGLGLGSPRFASDDPADAGITPSSSSTTFNPWPLEGVVQLTAFESFSQKVDPRGHDVKKEGPFQMENTGPRGGNAGAPPAKSNRHDGIRFPFSTNDGYMSRFALSFWVQPQSLSTVTLFDHSDGDPDRNRLTLLTRDDNLVLESIDEAGLDPNPSDSLAGVERTATQWSMPLTELGLPADTPLHVSLAAYGGRPSELSVAIDGMTRGKRKFVTYLTAPLKVFDPALANNNTEPGTPGNDRYLDIQVESTEGFPRQGVLRIGTELFEYSGIAGNSFQCKWKDSLGGRAARQRGTENMPAIPLDKNGEPTIDIDKLQQQGINLAVFPEHPVDSLVELYGYSTLLSEDTPMMPGTTRLESSVGGFAVARGWINNPKPIVITPASGAPLNVGTGIDQNWSGELELADPTPPEPPTTSVQESIQNAFSTSGGFALLIQTALTLESNVSGQLSTSTRAGGVELIRYAARQGSKLTGVQRAQTLPGIDAQISTEHYTPGVAQQFVTRFKNEWEWGNSGKKWNEIPTLILWVVPISLAVQNTGVLMDPQANGTSEWLQLYPGAGGDVNDTEWVRYDCLALGKHVARGNRAAWNSVRFELTRQMGREIVQVGPLGPEGTPTGVIEAPWGSVAATSGYIGYTPKLESDFPQVYAARRALQFRGDPFTRTTSHPQSNAAVMQCQRLELIWNNFGAFTGRPGRNDRVALVQGSVGNGVTRPGVEWHTVNWSARRFNADALADNQTPPERLGPKPFQLVAFKDGVQGAFLGPKAGLRLEPRLYDRIVKFPSGELPAAYCEKPAVGGAVGKGLSITGFVDEIEVRSEPLPDLVIDESFASDARTFRVVKNMTYGAMGPLFLGTDVTVGHPKTGGLLAIDNEIVAFQSHADGVFTVATNGRGLLNTEARGHDRGARVHFLAHRPAAILGANVTARDTTLPVQSVEPLDIGRGTVLLGRELLHYTWVQKNGDQGALDMPRWYPPGEDPTSTAARGLFRGRFGTTPQAGSTGEALIAFPFRYWDRQAERSDDPELACSQLTTTEAPGLYRSLRWREETTDPRVGVVCYVRTDSRAPWTSEPGAVPGFWKFEKGTANEAAHRIDAPGSRLEMRFLAVYKPGVLDLQSFRAHAWKTSVRVEDVRLEYEGQARIFDEKVTAR